MGRRSFTTTSRKTQLGLAKRCRSSRNTLTEHEKQSRTSATDISDLDDRKEHQPAILLMLEITLSWMSILW